MNIDQIIMHLHRNIELQGLHSKAATAFFSLSTKMDNAIFLLADNINLVRYFGIAVSGGCACVRTTTTYNAQSSLLKTVLFVVHVRILLCDFRKIR